MAKILILNPNTDIHGHHSIPTALVSSLLKKNNHEVKLFDTTFMKLDDIMPELIDDLTIKSTQYKYYKDVDFSMQDYKKKSVDVVKLFMKTIRNFNPDLICFSFWGSHLHAEGEYQAYHKSLKIIEKADTGDIPIIAGGTIPTSNPEMVLDHPKIHYVIRGEGELVYLDIANKLDTKESLFDIPNIVYKDYDGTIKKNEMRPLIEPLDLLPYPDFDIYDDRLLYRPYHGELVRCVDYELSRGCIYNCTFCLSPFQREEYGTEKGEPGHPSNFRREKSVDHIIREIKYLKDKYNLDIIRYQDETFLNMKAKKLSELADRYSKEVDLPFIIEATLNTVSKDKIDSIKKMGCISIGFGLESGSQRVRDEIIDKPRYTNEMVIERLKMVKKSGISFMLYNIIGFPGETEEDILETMKLNNIVKPPYATMSYLQPWEGTAIRKSALEKGNLGYDFSETEISLFQQRSTPFNNLDVSQELIQHYHDMFTYYIYLNRFLWPFIKVSRSNNILQKFLKMILTMLLKIRLRKYRH